MRLHCINSCLCLLVQLDSATSLITAAKNLMNAVISTVKASYVANTKVKLFVLHPGIWPPMQTFFGSSRLIASRTPRGEESVT